MAVNWECSFRVGPSQDKDERYAEVLSSVAIPDICVRDLQSAHDSVWTDFANNGEPTKPYAVYLQGWREGDTFDVVTRVDTNA